MPGVLLLNASYEPLTIITHKRATSLLLRQRVEAVTQEVLEIRGVSVTLRIPTVIRLRHYINVPRRGTRWSRRGVLERDRYICIYCGIQSGQRQKRTVLTKRDFSIDHILPISRGGQNSWGNTACACKRCNQRKGNRMPHEAGMKLRWEPKIPRVNYLVLSGAIPTAWKLYLDLHN